MNVEILGEAGYEFALRGIGKSFGVNDFDRLEQIAKRLAKKDGGHNKFLESIIVWLDIKAARYWWQEFDTYRVGTTKQSESTIHTIAKKPITQDDFSHNVHPDMIVYLNGLIDLYNTEEGEKKNIVFKIIKANLPEGYMQSRVVCTNYKVLRNMIMQRRRHVLQEWHTFIDTLKDLEHAYLLENAYGD